MPDELELVIHDVWRDARLLSCARAHDLAPHKADLIEVREALHDVLAKIETAEERRAA